MLSEINLATAQCAASWAQKFALLLTFRADQEEPVGIESIDSYIVFEIRQSCERVGYCRAKITVWESPSRINVLRRKEDANKIAKWAANASPRFWAGKINLRNHVKNLAFMIPTNNSLDWKVFANSCIKVNLEPIIRWMNPFFYQRSR
jgi:hypothetical protein